MEYPKPSYEELRKRIKELEEHLGKFENNRLGFLNKILDTISEPTALIDRNYKYVFVNEAYKKYLKKEPHEIVKSSVAEVFGEETFENTIKPEMDACLKGEKVEFETSYTFDSIEHYFIINYHPYFNNEGEISGVIATAKDITASVMLRQETKQKKEESVIINKELKKRNEKYAALNEEYAVIIEELKGKNAVILDNEIKLAAIFNNILDLQILWKVDSPGQLKIVNINDAYINKAVSFGFKVKKEDFIGLNIDQVGGLLQADETLIKETAQRYKKAMHTKKVIKYEESFEIQNRKFHTENSIIPILGESGVPKYMIFNSHNVTERKEAEEIIKSSEEKYRALFNQAPLAYQSLNEDGNILDVNPQWLETLGYKRDEVIGKWFGNFLHPDFVPIFRKNFSEFKKKGIIHDVQFNMLKKDGSNLFVSYEGCIGHDNKGNFKQTYCTFKDITKEKEAREELIESKRKLQTLLGNLKGMAYRCKNKQNWPMEYVSQGCLEITGYNSSELEEGGVIDYNELIHPDDKEEVWDNVQSALKQNSQFELEYRIITKYNEEKWVWERGAFVENKNGEIILEGFISDITERKLFEISLTESESRYKSMFYDNKSIMLLIDPTDGSIVDANDSALSYYGYTREQFLIKKITEINILSPEQVKAKIQKILNDKSASFQFKHRLADGRVRDVKVYSGKIYLKKRALLYSIIHDNTNELLAEKKLKDQNEEYLSLNEEMEESLKQIQQINADLETAKEKAEESDRLKSAFLANMSHEIRTPMNGIIGFSEIIAQPDLTRKKREHYSKIIISSSRQLLSIVNDILDISMIESGTIKFHIEKVAVDELIMDVFNFFKPQLSDKNISLIVDKDSKLGDSFVETDKVRLKQVLTNLLNNALKFTFQGYVKLGYKFVAPNLLFFVEDTGIGIEKDQHNKIFERFRQEETIESQQYGGTGLGLSISQKLINMLGGKMWVESEKGKGATFYFTIPYKPTNEPERTVSKNREIAINKEITILVAEDEDINYLYIEKVLSGKNIQFMHARDGKESVELCRTNPEIDLVLMDIKMPLMDGYEATKEIKAFRPNLPIIAQTAYAMVDDEKKALMAGCDGYLSKPIDIAKMIGLVNKLLK